MSEVNFLNQITFCEYPFFWELDKLSIDKGKVIIDHTRKKLEECGSDSFHRFLYNLILCYEHATKDEVDDSKKYLNDCNSVIETNDDFIRRYAPALTNILSACWAHLEFIGGELSEALNHLEKVHDLNALLPEQQSAIWAVRAHVTMQYAAEGTRKSLEFARKAVQLKDNESRWHLLLGRVLFRIRHFENVYPRPSEEELQHFELAVTLEESNENNIWLAGSYLDFTTTLWREKTTCDADIIDYYQKKAYKLLCRATELEFYGGAHSLIRCARAFTRLPASFKYTESAAKLMYQALEIAPDDPLINHYSGLICIKRKKFAEAAQYLLVALDCGVDKALYSLISINHHLNPGYDVATLYKKALSFVNDVSAKQYIHLSAAHYYLMSEKQLLKAVEHLIEAIPMNPNYPMLKDFKMKSVYGNGRYNPLQFANDLNLLSCVCNDVKYTLSHNSFWYKPEDRKKMNMLVEMLKDIIPDEVSKEPVKLFVNLEKGRTGANFRQKRYENRSEINDSSKIDSGRRYNNWRMKQPDQQNMSDTNNDISQQLQNLKISK